MKQMLVLLTAQLDAGAAKLAKVERLLRQLLEARSGRRSEQLSPDQLQLFIQELGAEIPAKEDDKDGKDDPPAAAGGEGDKGKPRGRRALPAHLKRERIVHDLAEQDKHCANCHEDLRRIGEEVSERYEYIPAQMKVIEDACWSIESIPSARDLAEKLAGPR